MTYLFMEACAQTQMRLNEDVNGAEQEGYGLFQMTADAKGRCHTDRAFLEPVKHLPNLRIITHALVTRVIIDSEDSAGRRMQTEFIAIPPFWDGHAVAPAKGDLVRLGGRQFLIRGRVWEHDAEGPVLKLYVGDAQAPSDTTFG